MKAVVCALLLVATAPTFAQDATPPVDSISAALAQARERRAPLLVDFMAPWCYSCYYMARNVTTGAEWERVRREAVVLELDVDSPEGARWMEAWTVKAIPTYVLLNGSGDELGRILGEQTRADFYAWFFTAAARADSLDALKVQAAGAGEGAANAAREVLRAYHARYDGGGGLEWFASLPVKARAALARDAQAAGWIARLELQRAAAAKDLPACLKAGSMVLAGNLGCERPYELSKVMACTEGLPVEQRREPLHGQPEFMQLLLDKRVFSNYRCADERSIVLGAANLHAALGDAASELRVLERAIADLRTRIGDDLAKDRNLADNLRVYLDRAGKTAELDELVLRLIAAFPDDYVYSFRHARSLAARNLHAQALPFFAQASVKAYGVNRLKNAELHARSLQALNRTEEARQVLAEALRLNGPWFPEDAAKLRALLTEVAPTTSVRPPASS